MSKDLYDLFNDSRTDADEKLNNYTYDDLPESEVEHIMNSVMDRKKKYKRDNSSNLYFIGFAVVIVLIVSFLGFALWKRFNPLNKYDNMVVNSNDEEENDIDYAASTEEEDKQQSTEGMIRKGGKHEKKTDRYGSCGRYDRFHGSDIYRTGRYPYCRNDL